MPKKDWEKEFDKIVFSYKGTVPGFTLLETFIKLKQFIKSLLEKKKGKYLSEVIKEIRDWMDKHQKSQATFSTNALVGHLMKKFLKEE